MTFDFFNDSEPELNRPAELQKIAHQLGGTYSIDHPVPLLDNFANAFGYDESELFERKNEHPLTGKLSNFISAKFQGQNVAVFDQTHYIAHNDYNFNRSLNTRRAMTQTFFLTEIKGANFPLFCIQPIGAPGNFTKNIDFSTHPNLSKKCVIYSKDETRTRRLFTPEVLNFFDNNIPFTLFAGEKYLLIYQTGILVYPHQIIASLNFITYLANLFLRRV